MGAASPHLHNATPTAEAARSMLQSMVLIRRTEERLSKAFFAGELPNGPHLYIGQEAIAAGVCAHLTDADSITSTHRGHGHYLAKGGHVGPMIAEIYGKATGICRGMGGSMHVADFSKGIIGANGIVGAGMPIATGAALAARMDGNGAVAVCFFGDGAASEGALFECLNIAALWKLPVIFVCEHNGYSQFSPADTVTAGVIAARAKPFGVPSEIVDGNDLLAVWRCAGEAIDRARTGGGPSFIQAQTYRLHGHIEAEVAFLAAKYRADDEVADWRERDPIPRTFEALKTLGAVDDKLFEGMIADADAAVDAAFAFAAESPFPELEQAFDFMFTDQRP